MNCIPEVTKEDDEEPSIEATPGLPAFVEFVDSRLFAPSPTFVRGFRLTAGSLPLIFDILPGFSSLDPWTRFIWPLAASSSPFHCSVLSFLDEDEPLEIVLAALRFLLTELLDRTESSIPP